ncbi:MAG TPA: ROK family protein [Sphingopyxis sp.]|uniref:ROK family protein n=1 Tax=Sphingopyxis sp. TaxID=1908224 RepID=UPI002B8365D9|nr:ROK family protein [Sphingopyxis sp.]HWW56289.1 ROK family protein [Sphingopyxis sp.]
MTGSHIFGLELGGTKCVALRAEGHHIVETIAVPTAEPGATLGVIDDLFGQWQRERQPDALGIASFGPVGVDRNRPDWGFILNTPKPGWAGTDIAGRYRRLLGVEVGFDTDVNAAALAETLWGGAVGTSCNAYITLGTGIGVGCVVRGEPLHGWQHPEFGHLKARRMPGDVFRGNCPFHGDCIEGLISGPAIARRSGMAGEQVEDKHPVWDGVVHDLGELLAGLILGLSPERISLGGSIACARPWLVERARGAVIASLGGYFDNLSKDINRMIGVTALGDRAGPLGAIALGMTRIAAGK